MKNGLLVFCLLVFSTFGFSQSYLEELENSYERSKGGSGASVSYVVHLSASSAKSYYAKNFSSGVLVKNGDKAVHYELTKKEGESKSAIIINLETVKLIEFEITYPKGECKYSFDFYY
ncbi:MAG: hypothetical protein ACI857_000702 [Arenicella sp.]|jgi:hypothetical protein